MTGTDLFDLRARPALERLLAGVVAHLPKAVAVVSANDGTILYTNANWNHVFGYAHGEVVGRHLSSVHAPSGERFPGERIRKIAAALDHGGVWTGRVESVRRDGARFWCSEAISQFDHESLGPVWVMLYAEVPAP